MTKHISARLGREPKPVKRFTPPYPASYWREKKHAVASPDYHRSHVEHYAHA